MNLISKLRIGRARQLLKEHRNKRSRQHHSVAFEDARSLGILFQANSMEEVSSVKELSAWLKEQDKKVSVLGYTKAADETAFKTKSVFFDYFTEKDLNLFLIPSPERTGDFIDEPFDILISLCLEPCFPLEYLTALSNATFRIGPYNQTQLPDLDLMLHLKEDRNIDNFAAQLKQYLSLPASA